MGIHFEFIKTSNNFVLMAKMAKMEKKLNKIGLLQPILKDNAPPLVLFCIEAVPKVGHRLLKYN